MNKVEKLHDLFVLPLEGPCCVEAEFMCWYCHHLAKLWALYFYLLLGELMDVGRLGLKSPGVYQSHQRCGRAGEQVTSSLHCLSSVQ